MSARVSAAPGRLVLVFTFTALAIGSPQIVQPGYAQSIRAAVEAAPEQLPAQLPAAALAPAREPQRPAMLAPLYGSYIGLQALDIHSTRMGVSSGRAEEANPVMRGFAGNSAGMIAVKAAATAGVIYGTEKLWKRNRVAAVVAMVALNSATAVIVARNYRIAH